MRSSRAGSDRSAFTLLELLVVLALVTIVAVVAITTYFGRTEVSLENAADLLLEDLRSAQARATWSGSPVEVVFAGDGGGYEVVESAPVGRTSALGPPIPPRRFGTGAVFEGVRIASADFGGRRTLVFDARGGAIDGGKVELRYLDQARTIEVERKSGRLRMPERTLEWDVSFR